MAVHQASTISTNPEHIDTMTDNNLIARVYAWPRDSSLATETIRRSRFAVLPLRIATAAARFGRHARCTTPNPYEGTETQNGEKWEPYIQVSFNRLPKTSHGLVFGCDWESDVILPDECSISAFHFSITFDEQNRLIVKDLNSTSGTEVTFGAQGHGRRRNFQWLIGGINELSSRQIVIKVSERLSFCIVPEKLCTKDVDLVNKMAAFSQRLGADLSFQSLSTRLEVQLGLSRTQGSPKLRQGHIHLRKVLGKGSYGLASYMWNVSTGEESVVKEPVERDEDDLEYTDESVWESLSTTDPNILALWKKEASNMRILRHENIVQLLHAEFTPTPRLFLEYCPGGSLVRLGNKLQTFEVLQVLQQSLAGLQYAHGLGIAHRDLKPENILVMSRNPLKVKLADFGLSQSAKMLQTFCGTEHFLAPEFWSMGEYGSKRCYTAAVDIWALGVAVYELLFDRCEGEGVSFCEKLVRKLQLHVQKHRGTIAAFLAEYMLKLRPDDRASAAECHFRAMALSAPTDQVQRRPIVVPFISLSSDTESTSASETFSTGDCILSLNGDGSRVSDLSSYDSEQQSTSRPAIKRSAEDSENSNENSRPYKRHLSSQARRDNVSGWSTALRRTCASVTLPTLDEESQLGTRQTESHTDMESEVSGEEYPEILRCTEYKW